MRVGRVTSIFPVIFPIIHAVFWCNDADDLSSKGWKKFNGALYYHAYDRVRNYTESESYCASYGGSLATAKTQEENQFIHGLVPSIVGATGVSEAGFGISNDLEFFLDNVECSGNESSIYNCKHREWRSHNCHRSEYAGVRCGRGLRVTTTSPSNNSSQIRLVDGGNYLEGRVEVYYEGSWGTVCDDFWNANDAEVVCRMLGYSFFGATAECCALFGSNTNLDILLDNVQCIGNESSVFNCSHTRWRVHNCNHFEDASVRCGTGHPIRLVGSRNPLEGRVEIYYNGSWGMVCDNAWDNNDAEVVCRMLGYRASSYVGLNRNPSNGNSWLWADGETASSTAWNTSDPTDGHNCAYIQDNDYQLSSCGCDTRLYSICKCTIPTVFHMNLSVRLVDVKYTDSLNNTASTEYRRISNAVVSNISNILLNVTDYQNSSILRFDRANDSSTLAEVEIVKFALATENMDDIKSVVKNIWKLPFGFGTWSLHKYILGGAITASNSGEFVNGTLVYLNCTFSSESVFHFKWYYRGSEIRPKNGSRIGLQEIRNASTSILNFQPLIEADSGLYECVCKTNTGKTVSEAGIRIAVIVPAVVRVMPLTQTVEMGSNASLTCTVVNDADRVSFEWEKEGTRLRNESDYFAFSLPPNGSRLDISTLTHSAKYSCSGSNSAGHGTIAHAIVNVCRVGSPYCKAVRDEKGTTWNITCGGVLHRKLCPTGSKGEITRFCTEDGKWREPHYGHCVNDTFDRLRNEIDKLENGVLSANVPTILETLEEATHPGETEIGEDELEIVVDLLNRISNIENSGEAPVGVYQNFLDTASNILDKDTTSSWQSMISKKNQGAEKVLSTVETFVRGFTGTTHMNESKHNVSLRTRNIDVETGYRLPVDLQPTDNDSFHDNQDFGTRLILPMQGGNNSGISEHSYAAVFYKNLSGILQRSVISDGEIMNAEEYDIGPVVMSLQLDPPPTNLSAPIRLFFRAFDTKYTNPLCSYWNFSARGNGEGAWSSDGCSVVSMNSSGIVCECNHLTNFAILMSPSKISDPYHSATLSIISAVGCAVSLACLVVTVIVHLLVWRYVRSQRTNTLMNICIALIVSYVIFLGGVNRTENKAVCTAVAALIHYFYLAVFFLMLVEGIELAVTVLIVFATKSRLKWLLPLAWLIPAGIVGASLGISGLKGYGNEKFCWLSVQDGLIWAFVGPAVLVIVINAIIIMVIIKMMFTTSVLSTKTNQEKAKTTLKSLAVLLPITGVTWILGIFSVNENLAVFQYLFTIFNSLQGLFIFIFHCLLNKQIRKGMRAKIKRRKSVSTSFSNFTSTSGQMSRSLREETNVQSRETDEGGETKEDMQNSDCEGK